MNSVWSSVRFRTCSCSRKKAFSLVRIPGMDYATFRTRLGSFLQRRGFGYETSNRTIRTLWEELKGDTEIENE